MLLRHNGLTLGDISDQLGFENPPSFTRFFKREAGLTSHLFRWGWFCLCHGFHQLLRGLAFFDVEVDALLAVGG